MTIATQLRDWLAQGEALVASVEALEMSVSPAPAPEPPPAPAPEPPPAPAPEPPPAPAPEPPPAPVIPPQMFREKINPLKVVWPSAWCWTPNYQRFTTLVEWTPGQQVTIEYQRGKLRDSSTPLDLSERTYTLSVQNEIVSTVVVPSGVKKWNFSFTAPVTPGWVSLVVSGLGPDETQITYFACIVGAKEDTVPVIQSSFELSKMPLAECYHSWSYMRSDEYFAAPTPDHSYDPVTVESSQRADMLCSGDRFPPTIHSRRLNGEWSTTGVQPYFWDDVIRKIPKVHLKDGPRGIGTMCMPTHIEIGRATQTADPTSAPRKNIYVAQPWRVTRVSNTGHITTLVGYRHKTGASDESPELVGDWSSIPQERHGFWLIWGLCWDSRTLSIDTSAAPLPDEDNRQPHSVGPRMYVTDSRNNRICRVEFSKDSHSIPPKVTEIATGKGYWEAIEDPSSNTMLVSIRDENRVVRMSFDGQILETIIEKDSSLPGNILIDNLHVAKLNGCTLAEAQVQPILAPEGLYLLDNHLYVASYAQQLIRVIDLATKSIVRTIPVVMARQSTFVKVTVSDGSYALRGTTFFNTFGVSDGSRGYGIKPDGTKWISSKNCHYAMEDYQMACGIGGGRMIAGGSDFGLYRYYKGDVVDINKYKAGQSEFENASLRLIYGPNGVGGFKVDGEKSEALQYFLDLNYVGQ